MKMNAALFLLASIWVLLTNGVPQRFEKYSNSPGRQYFQPPQAMSYMPGDFNLTHGEVDAPNDDGSVDETMANFLYQNIFIEMVNEDFPDPPIIPNDPVEESAPNESDSNNQGEIAIEESNDKDVVYLQHPESNPINSSGDVTTKLPYILADADDDAYDTESPTDQDLEIVDDNNSLSIEKPDHVITPFVHPIHRPSSQWPLNVGNPHRKRIKHHPQKGGNHNKKNNRKRINVHRHPVRGQTDKKKRRRRPNKRVGLPVRNPRPNNSNKIQVPSSCGSCQCGVQTTRRRAGNKEVAAINEFPWLALITYNDTIQCAGTLINDRYVLTAAHCVLGFNIKLFQIRFLEHNIAKSTITVLVLRRISRIYSLNSYDANTSDNDIAIIRLSKPIKFPTTTVRPICLPTDGMDLVGQTATIAGAGTKRKGSKMAGILQKATIPIITNEQCLLVGKNITKNMLCTGRLLEGGIESCQGDSGGPLMVIVNKRYYLGGVISWGDGCAEPHKPGVYAKATNYLRWISKKTCN